MTAKSWTMRVLVSSALACLATAAPAAPGSITGSPHDFTSGNPNPTYKNLTTQTCVSCHTPHAADTATSAAALWNHANSAQSYSTYSSSTMKAAVGAPGPSSKLCLSCHDGSIAVDSFGGAAGNVAKKMDPTSRKTVGSGNALTDDHPIGFTYDSNLATLNGSLFDPASKNVTIGASPTKSGTISSLLLYAGKMECSSCHDVHNTFTTADPGMVKISTASSAICFACHNK
jgi:predicted CXXCH cytochrome family protein